MRIVLALQSILSRAQYSNMYCNALAPPRRPRLKCQWSVALLRTVHGSTSTSVVPRWRTRNNPSSTRVRLSDLSKVTFHLSAFQSPSCIFIGFCLEMLTHHPSLVPNFSSDLKRNETPPSVYGLLGRLKVFPYVLKNVSSCLCLFIRKYSKDIFFHELHLGLQYAVTI